MKKNLLKVLLLFVMCIKTVYLAYAESDRFEKLMILLRESIGKSDGKSLIDPESWTTIQDSTKWPELVVTSQDIFDYNEIEISACNRKKITGNWDSMIVNISSIKSKQSSNIPYNMAFKIYSSIIKIFGQPTRMVDYGFISTTTSRFDLLSQWDFGNIRAYLLIVDMDHRIKKQPGIMGMYLQISQKDAINELVPLSPVKFVPKYGYITKGPYTEALTPKDLSDYELSIVFDYNKKYILNTGLMEIGQIEELQENQAIAIMTSNKIVFLRFILDRYTGKMEAIIYDENTGVEVIRITGQAEKIDLTKPKF